MVDYTQLVEDQKRKLLKAMAHLDYSYQKIKTLPEDISQLDEEALETWESFSARFSRVADLFLNKYIRAFVLKNDPGFEGSLRDFVNQGEKLGLIDEANAWMEIRQLRNISAHEYSEKDLMDFFKQIKAVAPRVLRIRSLLK